MRITGQAKERVRQRILDRSRTLFRHKDPAAVNTRELASAADIAHGTLFNYFASKEALLLELVRARIDAARADFAQREPPAATLEEDLFALVAAELAALRPDRRIAAAAFAAALGPIAPAQGGAADFRASTLQLLAARIAKHAPAPSLAVLHLAWSLYCGVLGFWVHDDSPNQEDTLALLDEATRLVSALARGTHDKSGA